MKRTWLALALVAVCAIQASEALALIVPDDCATLAGTSSQDEDEDCASQCARCLCCARRPLSLRQNVADLPLREERTLAVLSVPTLPISHVVRDVFHVPKLSLHSL